MNTEALIAYVSTTPLTWLIVTIGAYKIGILLYEKSGNMAIFQPMIISMMFVLPVLYHFNIPYQTYFKSVDFLHFFLGPATVALAVPLYKNLKHIQAYFMPIVITLFVGGLFTIFCSVGILWLLGASKTTFLSMTTKSVTAPISIIVAQEIGAIVPLSIAFIAITGLLGSFFGKAILSKLHIKSDAAKGFSLGLIAHALGTSTAVEISETAAAFAALAMGLCGVATAVFLPLALHHLL